MKLDGKSLERATSLIETHILNHISKSEIGEVTIESNKIIICEGVKNEIDVYVTIDLKIGTKLTYIFECKNYKTKKISKNDIIIFDEKIKIYNAQKGYFIAKRFTKDARNRAFQNKRMELLDLDNENSRIFDKDYFIQLKGVYIEKCELNIEVYPAIPFEKEFEFLPIKIPDSNIKTVHDLIVEKLNLGSEKAIKYRTIEDARNSIDFQSDFEKVETLHTDINKWIFRITLEQPIFNNIHYGGIRIRAEVDYIQELPQIIFEYNIKEKGHYAKLKMRGLFKNDYYTMEVTKNDNTNEIHIHNIVI